MNKFFSSPTIFLENLAARKKVLVSSIPDKTPLLEKRDWSSLKPVEGEKNQMQEETKTQLEIKMQEEKNDLLTSVKEKPQLPIATPYLKVPTIKKKSKRPLFSAAEKASQAKKILSLTKPEFLDSKNPFINKMMKIIVTYVSSDDKQHQKTVFFGSRHKAYYITHKNEYLRDAALHKLKGDTNFLEPKFYEMELLNGPSEDLEENYLILLKKIIS